MKDLITQRINRAISEKVFPGCVIGIVKKDGTREVFPFGYFTYESDSPKVKEETIYDVASLTKSLAGAAALLKLIDEGKLGLNEKVYNYVPGFDNHENKREVSIRHLLTYTLDLDIPSMSTVLKHKTADEIEDIVIQAPLKTPPGTKFQYVNSTAFFMHTIVEKISGMTLDVFCHKYFYGPLGMNHTKFRPTATEAQNIPPTEIDSWRNKTVQGEVHDESTHILQSKYSALAIAGLFSSVPDILTFQEMLLNGGEKKDTHYFSPEIVRMMHTNQLASIGSFAGLGWALNDPSFMGTKTSPEAFAKTGFTGCLMITDPIKNIAFTMLSNWSYPTRPSSREALNTLRRDIADIIFS